MSVSGAKGARKSKSRGRGKHVPQRTCVVCRTVHDKRELVRLVRTPEGLYRITWRRELGQTSFYKALLLDYPNGRDRRLGRTGSHIEIHGMDDIITYLQQTQVGQQVTLTLIRDGRELTLPVELGERPLR